MSVSIPVSVLRAGRRRDGAVLITGQHEAWVSVGIDPRECLIPGQRGEAARAFGQSLSRFCAAAVSRLEGRN